MTKEQLEKEIEKIWDLLTQTSQGVMRGIQGSNASVLLVSNNNTISFMLKVSANAKVDIKKQSYANLSISVEPISPDKAIVVTLNNQKFRNTFAIIAADVIYSTMPISNEAQAIDTFCKKLNIWRNVFMRGRDELMDAITQTGLYGELTFIKDLLDNTTLSPMDIIEAWTGPDKEDKDFQYRNYAVEIKTSLKTDKITTISNLKQLDNLGLKGLYLYHYEFAKAEGGPNTLPVLINDLRTILIPTQAINLFEDKLIEYGYLNKDADEYKRSYTLRDENAYLVDSSFPKITASMVPGVLNASYTIDLNSCATTAISLLINTLENA